MTVEWQTLLFQSAVMVLLLSVHVYLIERKMINSNKIMDTLLDLQRQTDELKQILQDNNNRVLKEVAYGKISTQSTQLREFNSGKANDGNFYTFSHTAMNAETSFWEVDLGRKFKIKQIQIFVRKDCCGDLIRQLDILVGPSHDKLERCAFYEGPAQTGFHLVLDCANIISGQFVKIVKGVATNLALAEVKVMAFDEN